MVAFTLKSLRLSALAALMPLIAAPVLAAEDLPGNPSAGRGLANRVCTECHEVSREGGPSPNRYAPGFRDLARQPSTTALSLRVFLQSPHRRMPDFTLSDQERDDLIAYILSLRENRNL